MGATYTQPRYASPPPKSREDSARVVVVAVADALQHGLNLVGQRLLIRGLGVVAAHDRVVVLGRLIIEDHVRRKRLDCL